MPSQTPIPNAIRSSAISVYKYSGLEHPERLKKIVLEHELYVPTVKQLNDPTEGRPLLAKLSEEKMFEFLYGPSCNPTLTNNAQQRATAVLRYNIRLHGTETLQRQMVRMLNKLLEGYRVYSLSKRFDNLSLWAKYADGHTGYCLEFSRTDPFFDRVVEVIYCKTIPMDVTDSEQRRSYFLYCKRPEWSDEEEVRVVLIRGSIGVVKIDPRCLNRVILGEKVSGENENSIREWAALRNPALTVVKAHFDEVTQQLVLR